MRKKCESCGNIIYDTNTCPNCGCEHIKESPNDMTWYNLYASERMTPEEAREFFDSDKY